MAEYREPEDDIDDLMGDDDDDDEYTEDQETELLNVEDLVNSRKEEKSSKPTRDAGDELLFLSANIGLNDSDSDEDMDKAADTDAERRADEVARRAKLRERFNVLPPGINLFPDDKIQESKSNGYHYFSLDTLDLEKDFSYNRRGQLKGHGFTDEKIDTILKDRLEFVKHLMPEAQSVLICDKNDFRAIMNYLFYSLSVCTDRNLYDLMAKAFFDLRKNYGFRWNLQPKHILGCLLNYGADEAAVYKESFYRKCFQPHLDAVIKSGQKISNTKYKLPELPWFVTQRRKQKTEFVNIPPKRFNFAVSRFIILVSDFSAGLPQYLEFRYRNEWSNQAMLIYFLLLLGTDKRFVENHAVKDAVKHGIHYHLDSFTSNQWFWGPDKQGPTKGKSFDFNKNNVPRSLVVLLDSFSPGDQCPNVKNWEIKKDKKEMTSTLEGKSDHHLNLVYRLSLIPPSSRGNQFKKHLAFMYLQTLVELNDVALINSVDVHDLVETPGLCDQKTTFFKVIANKTIGNYGLLTSIVELYDIIVGHEPSLDFTEDKVNSIEKVRTHVLNWLSKALPRGNINLSDPRMVKGLSCSEYVDMVDMRWESWIKRVPK